MHEARLALHGTDVYRSPLHVLNLSACDPRSDSENRMILCHGIPFATRQPLVDRGEHLGARDLTRLVAPAIEQIEVARHAKMVAASRQGSVTLISTPVPGK